MSLLRSADQLELPERLSWDDFKRQWRWPRGQHCTILGPTGAGKTFLMTAILDKHPDTAVLNLKPNDETLHERLPSPAWQYVPHWPPYKVDGRGPNRVVLHPKRQKMDDTIAHQTRVVRYMFRRIYEGPPHCKESERGCWTIAIPDLSIVLDDLRNSPAEKRLGLQSPADQLELLYKHGRGIRVSLVIDAQTTAWLERLALDQPAHFFFFKPRDRDRAKRMAEIGNADPKQVAAALDSLDPEAHEVLYVNAGNGKLAITVPE